MSLWLIILIAIVLILIIAAVLRCIWELHSLSVSRYEIRSTEVKENNALHAVFLSDLHGCVYGENNKQLFELIRNEHPDVIFIGGDLFVCRNTKKDPDAIQFLTLVRDIAPVYFAKGNHEKGMQSLNMFRNRYKGFADFLDKQNIVFLNNETADINDDITITGLDIDYKYYDKVHPLKMTKEKMDAYLKEPDRSKFNIVMAHNPKYFDLYAESGYDLFLSGHLHGGAVRLPGLGGVISPQFVIFPKYSKGRFEKNKTTMVVTGGAGSHSVNIRLFNRPEIVVIDIKPEVV